MIGDTRQEDVLRLHIAVDDAAFMSGGETAGYVGDDRQGRRFVEAFLGR